MYMNTNAYYQQQERRGISRTWEDITPAELRV